MKHNAFTVLPTRLFRVWGPDEYPYVDLPVNYPVFVLWSPNLRQWVASITTHEYRYDALVTAEYFRFDPSLAPVLPPPTTGPAYYLENIRAK
jgi:hypothetical protein